MGRSLAATSRPAKSEAACMETMAGAAVVLDSAAAAGPSAGSADISESRLVPRDDSRAAAYRSSRIADERARQGARGQREPVRGRASTAQRERPSGGVLDLRAAPRKRLVASATSRVWRRVGACRIVPAASFERAGLRVWQRARRRSTAQHHATVLGLTLPWRGSGGFLCLSRAKIRAAPRAAVRLGVQARTSRGQSRATAAQPCKRLVTLCRTSARRPGAALWAFEGHWSGPRPRGSARSKCRLRGRAMDLAAVYTARVPAVFVFVRGRVLTGAKSCVNRGGRVCHRHVNTRLQPARDETGDSPPRRQGSVRLSGAPERCASRCRLRGGRVRGGVRASLDRACRRNEASPEARVGHERPGEALGRVCMHALRRRGGHARSGVGEEVVRESCVGRQSKPRLDAGFRAHRDRRAARRYFKAWVGQQYGV
ncbi:hypothetical protein PsYK624_101590 [Phanerochaete sordida]|uniref:Uncharacterized protein n=1 Tax=Phanerochaete sordida TaxID=48140 RepID=A0A9P3GFM8_9APHY|nr:hypothetical protein PsYK624_101590 [Phanerochaete sordida]